MDELKEYLEKEWRYNNHAKYQKYFNEWFKNLTEIQIFYFKSQMENSNIKI